MHKRVQSIKLREKLPEIIQETAPEMILLNTLQLLHGQDSKGDTLRPEYRNVYYSRKKNARNPLPGYGVPDLRDTGDFYKDFTLDVDEKSYTLSSNDWKSVILTEKYGPHIFGLMTENKEKYISETLRPKIQKYITGKTGLDFK